MIYSGRKIVFIPGDAIRVTQPAAAAIIPWYLSGGIAAVNCMAAYQPKGAADYAGSKVNLANPGTYNAVNGAAYPTWDVTDGWIFAKASKQFLTTGYTLTSTSTVLVRFSAAAEGAAFGNYNYTSGGGFAAFPKVGVSQLYFCPGTITKAEKTSGNLCIAGNEGFRDGVSDGTGGTSWPTLRTCFIGANSNQSDSVVDGNCLTGKIQALAIYDTVLTLTQIGLLVTAMAAL